MIDDLYESSGSSRPDSHDCRYDLLLYGPHYMRLCSLSVGVFEAITDVIGFEKLSV